MYTCEGAPFCIEYAKLVKANLAAIGITLHIHPLPSAELEIDAWAARRAADITFQTRKPTFPTPPTSSTTCSTPPRPIIWAASTTRRLPGACARQPRQRGERLRANPPRRGPDQKRPSSRGMGNAPSSALLRARRLSDLPAGLGLRPRNHLSPTMTARSGAPSPMEHCEPPDAGNRTRPGRVFASIPANREYTFGRDGAGPAAGRLGCCSQIGNQKPGRIDTSLLSRATTSDLIASATPRIRPVLQKSTRAAARPSPTRRCPTASHAGTSSGD